MATLSETKICLFWYRIEASGIFSNWWNGDSTADPDTLQGGIPFAVGAMMDEPLYLFACGTGDAGISINFGPAINAFAPKTYLPGWPAANGAPDVLDPASVQGSAVRASATHVDFPSTPGCINSFTGQRVGRFYFQYTLNYDIFSGQAGCGVMRAGSQVNFVQQGRKNVSDPVGGPMINGGNIGTTPPYTTSVEFQNVSVQSQTKLGAPSGSVMGVAVALIPQFEYVPSLFSPVKLPPLICCPINRNRALARFRRNLKGQP